MKIYNTLTRQKQEFVPINKCEVKMYSCGPTVYDYFHIGNARPFIVFDTMRRYLEYQGYKVTFVQNFTDIDDKMIKRANEEGITVKELCYFGRNPYKSIFGTRSQKDEEMVNWAIRATGLEDFENRQLDSLSGGQRQRAWIAMALTQDTDVLLLDEPTTYLDLAHQIEILELLKDLNNKTKKTIVIVIHELNHAARYAHNLVCMKHGNIYSQGEVDDVFNENMLRDVFGVDSIVISDPITQRPMCIPK